MSKRLPKVIVLTVPDGYSYPAHAILRDAKARVADEYACPEDAVCPMCRCLKELADSARLVDLEELRKPFHAPDFSAAHFADGYDAALFDVAGVKQTT